MNVEYLVKKESVDLSFNGLHDGNIEILVKVLQKSEVLRELNLWSNRISLDDDTLTDALAQCSTIQVLSLGSNQIGSEGGKRLAAALADHPSIREIHLGDNRIGDVGAEAIADALASNESLQILSVYGNNIGDAGARSLAGSFKLNQSLRVLWLHENKIGDDGAAEMVEALKSNTSVKRIFLLNNKISKRVERNIETVLNDPSCRKNHAEVVKAMEAEAEAEAAKAAEQASKDEELSKKDEEIAALRAELEAKDKEIQALKEQVIALQHSKPIMESVSLESVSFVGTSKEMEKPVESPFEDTRDDIQPVKDQLTLEAIPSVE